MKNSLFFTMKRTVLFVFIITVGCVTMMADSIAPFGQWSKEPWEAKGFYAANNQQEPDGAWYALDFDDSAWDDVSGPMGAGDFYHCTIWEANYSKWWLRRHFTLNNIDETHVYKIYVTHDDECRIYLNGIEIYYNSAYTLSDSYITITLTEEMLKLLKVGDNLLAVYVADTKGYGKHIDFGFYDDFIEKDNDGYYLISSIGDWQTFATLAERNSIAKAKMTADINLGSDQTMIGYTVPYKGTFDGQGHTLTVNYLAEEGVAPFRYVNGGTIERIHVRGSIEATRVGVGGIINVVGGDSITVIRDCWSSAVLTSGTGDIGNTIGGLVAGNNGTLVIEDCLFDGKFADKNTRYNAGFVSNNWSTLIIRNSLNLGTYHSQPTYQSGTFYRPDVNSDANGTVTLDNVYYRTVCGTPQGAAITDTQLADSTVTRCLQNGRYEERWMQGEHEPILTFEDYTDLSVLIVGTSKTIIVEGDTFQITVTVAEPVKQETKVSFVSEHPLKFSSPQTAKLAVGERSVTINVVALDNDVPELDDVSAFTIYVPGYEKGEALVMLKDNDLPVLELMLTPDRVKESSGPVSVSATLRRTTNTNSKISVRLSDDSAGGLYLGQTNLELPKGVNEVHFNLGPVDNIQVDGDRTYTVTAAVWLSSCSCSATGQAAGSVSAQLQVYDDDGPALSLTSQQSMIKEGATAMLTINRNTATDNELTVTLNSNQDDLLSYEHTVTIPAGQQSQTVEIGVNKNNVENDSKTVVFTVQSEGFSSGTSWLMVTDQTLPDARICGFAADKTECNVGEGVTLTVEISNEGVASLPNATPVKIYQRGSSTVVATLYTQADLAPSEKTTLSRLVNLPLQVGSYAYYAVINEAGGIKELSSANNTSAEVRVNVNSPYTATVITDKQVYSQGETITISGLLSGERIANVETEIYIINEGLRQRFAVTTDVEGHFSYEWHPYSQQSGHFSVGVCYPGENLTEEMASFDIYGLRRQGSGYITCDVTEGESFTGSIILENPGSLKLTGVKAEVLASPKNCNVKLELPSTINGGQAVQLKYNITGNTPTEQNAWEKILLKVQSAEGVSLEQPLYYYCRSLKAQLVVSESYINTTMTKGKERDYVLYVTNIGRGNSGAVSLSLPEWIKSASGTTVASLAQNDTATVVLRLKPTNDMQLNVPVTGHFGINCANGDGKQIDYNVTPVSEATGTLTIDVCDENTYYTDAKPHVEGAEVVVRNPVTQALVTQGLTGSDGRFSITLPEGYYQICVTANNHDSYKNNILVDPGTETVKTVNLSIRGIEISYTVEETEEEDKYIIVTHEKFETNVPVPVVVLSGPTKIDGDSMADGEEMLLTYTLTNEGLINALNVNLHLPVSNDKWAMRALESTGPFMLAPGQSVSIPVLLCKLAKAADMKRRSTQTAAEATVTTFNACYASIAYDYEHICGDELKRNSSVQTLAISTCVAGSAFAALADVVTSLGWDKFGYIPQSLSGGPQPPNGNVNDIKYSSPSDQAYIDADKYLTFCNPDDANCAATLIKTLLGFSSGIAASGLEHLTEFSENLQVLQNEREKAQEEGRLVEDVEKDWVKNQLLSGMKQCNAILEEADKHLMEGASDMVSFSSIGNSIGAFAGKTLKIFLACENSYNRLHPRDTLGRGDKLQTFYDAYHLYTDISNIVEEMLGTEMWKTRMGQDVEILLNYLLNDVNMLYMSIDEIVANRPPSITAAECKALSERIVNTIERYKFVKGEFNHNFRHKAIAFAESTENYINLDSIFAWTNDIASLDQKARDAGFASMNDMFLAHYAEYLDYYSNPSQHVCAIIGLDIPQTLTFTRQAFLGTLTVYNGHENTPMKDVKLTLLVTNAENDSVATPHEFQINAEKMTGFDGELDFSSGWTLAAKDTGRVEIKFIPTKYAAPKEPVKWSFGGVLSYVDPFTGLEVRRELYPVILTVNPSPVLDLDYFMQRDIYGDDPLTEDVKEPIIPAEFALIISNKGEGDAKSVRMITSQPQIVENEKGLATGFVISSTQNGDSVTLNLCETITNDFGTIPAGGQAWAQWWICDSLLGHFTDYDVTVNHLTSYGNADLSLIDKATVHELIHGFTPVSGTSSRGFLVNDLPDDIDLPDIIYFTDGTQENVSVLNEDEAHIQKISEWTYKLSLTGTQAGWVYGSLDNPTGGLWQIESVTRHSDNAIIPSDNMWQTDRTLRDGQDWLYESRLHFIAQIPAGGDTYTLIFVSKENTTGLMELTDNDASGVHISPLPLGEWMRVTGKYQHIYQLEIYDMYGIKQLGRTNIQSAESINVGQLPVGIYFVRIVTDGGVYYIKLMKR